MNKWLPIAMVLVLLAGLLLRIPRLAERPMHHDEANQAYRFGILLEQGSYTYDAEDHHGPSLYYLTLPIAWLGGAQSFADTTEHTYRLLPVLFGLLLILCTPLLRNGIGSTGVLTAALLTAISPAMAYYSRFYIQEMLLVFFTFITIAAGWRSLQTGSIAWSIAGGIAAGLMFATKETAVIAYAAMFGSALLCLFISRNMQLPIRQLIVAVLAALAVAFVLFSSFLTNMQGPLDSILAFKGYLVRGSGIDTDHVHPWNFYLKMLTYYRVDGGPVWSEALIFLLGVGGCILIALKKIPAYCNPGLARFLMFYTLLLTLVYSVIAYKTPWCILSFLHGWILLAGIAVAAGVESARAKPWLTIPLALLFLGASTKLYATAHRSVFRYAADYRNPYVYAHTVGDFMNLVKRVDDVAAAGSKGRELYIQVIAEPDATWPLPFYLRGYPNTGFWTAANNAPTIPKADIMITEPGFQSDNDAYVTELYGLRPDKLLTIHIERNLWNRFIESK